MIPQEQIKSFFDTVQAIRSEIAKEIIGQERVVEQLLTALIAGGNVLLEGVPGLGKTRLVRTLSSVFDLPFSRIQFTPDLMPADITGTNIIVKTEAGNEFRGKRIGHGEGALWKNGNWKLVTNLYKPSWGESYQHIAQRMDDFAREKVAQHPGEQIVVVSHESPIFSYRHYLETGHPEHWMFLRHTALASVTSVTYDNETGRVMSITYVDPAANVKSVSYTHLTLPTILRV